MQSLHLRATIEHRMQKEENYGRIRAPEDILISFPKKSSLQQSEKSESNLMSIVGRKRWKLQTDQPENWSWMNLSDCRFIVAVVNIKSFSLEFLEKA